MSSVHVNPTTDYRPHLQAIRDHLVCKVDVMTRIAVPLADKFGLAEHTIVFDGNGYIDMFKQWLNRGNCTWKKLLDVLHDLDERLLANDLQRKVENKGTVFVLFK